MSKFAHGIRALDLSYPEEEEEGEIDTSLFKRPSSIVVPPIWLLGVLYSQPTLQAREYYNHFESILWMTYRKDFPAMVPYEHTSDAGWGCMLRSAQMILCQALQRHLFGSNWRLRIGEKLEDDFIKLLGWFVDAPAMGCVYSIHNMVKIGMQYDKLPGEWYGPTTACQVLRDLVNLHSKELNGFLSMYVPQEGVVYTEDVKKLCVMTDPSSSRVVSELETPNESNSVIIYSFMF